MSIPVKLTCVTVAQPNHDWQTHLNNSLIERSQHSFLRQRSTTNSTVLYCRSDLRTTAGVISGRVKDDCIGENMSY